ncbi:transaldolase [Pseudoclavibacter sp. CFCC 11306]|uniref:transaldolase n=1 Tax=Pseudoclavibacter sp. CFCC 11306 TaxID=1564493 RepID=UPI0013012E2A|nr:transaldolase [Pseudoclavibacter sp. CFCC 11306]KAB1658293.1 transaldolase [Pseudoclavibacter sp. CFCC 11306]
MTASSDASSADAPLSALGDLSAAGVSVWLDDLSRSRIRTGDLQRLINTRDVVGVTTNPSIFDAALADGAAYADQLDQLAAAGASADEAVRQLTTVDVAEAAELLRPIYKQSNGVDGRVSIEVDPFLAHDTEATLAQARDLWREIARPNLMVKIPGTEEGLPAIADATAAGISVNVTLIFGVDRYREVINAYLTGLERAHADGIDISSIHSVASFFVSRVDVEVNKRLDALGVSHDEGLHNTAALANARAAYQAFTDSLDTERWRTLAQRGGNPQRPLWASTGVKDPELPDTTYVTGLVAEHTVNTMPEKTLEATFDHGVIGPERIPDQVEAAVEQLDRLAAVGIDLHDVTTVLEAEGVTKFTDAWTHLLETVDTAVKERR